jgi:predicted RNA-binding Zn-ribbon protein involved in translation (DUF1610 family)
MRCMSTLNRNRKVSIGCPNCKEPFQGTIATLETNTTFACPICGPVQFNQFQTDELRRTTLQQVKRVLSELERISNN